MSIADLAQLLAPFVAVLTASGWIHGQFTHIREELAALKVRVQHLEDELRNGQHR